MNNFLYFFWVGPNVPTDVKKNIQKWEKHLELSKSDIRPILLIDKSKYIGSGLIKKVHFRNGYYCDMLKFNDARYSFLVRYFDINTFNLSNKVKRYYNILLTNSIYPFASDIARILIAIHFQGIYMDCDISPSKKKFPCSNDFSHVNKTYVVCGSPKLIENRIILFINGIALYERNKALNHLGLACIYDKTFMEYSHNVNEMVKWQKSKEHKNISKSFFLGKNEYIKAFEENDKLNLALQNGSVFYKNTYNDFHTNKKEHLFTKELPNFYERDGVTTLSLFYDICIDICNAGNTYAEKYFNGFMNQYIYSSQDDEVMVYSWSNPGYFRLKKLNEVSKFIATRRNRIKLEKVNHSIKEILLRCLIKLIKAVEQNSQCYTAIASVINLLKIDDLYITKEQINSLCKTTIQCIFLLKKTVFCSYNTLNTSLNVRNFLYIIKTGQLSRNEEKELAVLREMIVFYKLNQCDSEKSLAMGLYNILFKEFSMPDSKCLENIEGKIKKNLHRYKNVIYYFVYNEHDLFYNKLYFAIQNILGNSNNEPGEVVKN